MPTPSDIEGIKAKLNAERTKLLEAFKGLTLDILTRPFEGGWSIKDVLAHVAMAEGSTLNLPR